MAYMYLYMAYMYMYMAYMYMYMHLNLTNETTCKYCCLNVASSDLHHCAWVAAAVEAHPIQGRDRWVGGSGGRET